MKCPEEIIQLMHDYLDEEIDPKDELTLREHLKSCKDCELLFNEFKRTIAVVKGTSRIQAPANFAENVMAMLPKEKRRWVFKDGCEIIHSLQPHHYF